MLHNKYLQVLQPLLSDYSSSVIGRELDKKIPLSQKGISLALNELESMGVLKSLKRGNQKVFSLNKDNSEILDYIHILELHRKLRFLQTNRVLSNIVRADKRITSIFGSYARGNNKPDSDLDIFIVGKREKEDYDTKAMSFDMDVSIKYTSEREFRELLIKKNPLISEIVHNHIILSGFEKFIGLIWRHYYGFN